MAKKLTTAQRNALVSLSNTGAYVQRSAIFGPRIIGALPTRSPSIRAATLDSLVARDLVHVHKGSITDHGRKALLES